MLLLILLYIKLILNYKLVKLRIHSSIFVVLFNVSLFSVMLTYELIDNYRTHNTILVLTESVKFKYDTSFIITESGKH